MSCFLTIKMLCLFNPTFIFFKHNFTILVSSFCCKIWNLLKILADICIFLIIDNNVRLLEIIGDLKEYSISILVSKVPEKIIDIKTIDFLLTPIFKTGFLFPAGKSMVCDTDKLCLHYLYSHFPLDVTLYSPNL